MASINGDQVFSPFQLSNHRVCSMSLNTVEFSSGGEAKLDYKFDYEFSIGDTDTDWVGKILFTVGANCKSEDSKGSETQEIFSFTLKIEGEFVASKDSSDEEKFKERLSVNGLTIMTQLTRSYLATATSFWGIGPAVILPMINIHDLIKCKEENISIKE